MNEVDLFPRHGLTRNTKRAVFLALLERQQGKCFICGVSQAELEGRHLRHDAPVHRTLHIDHCHKTGMIRGLLCGPCNAQLGHVENYGFKPMPNTTPLLDGSGDAIPFTEEEFTRICDMAGRFLERHMDAVLSYMQQDRWLPRKDILFHLQIRQP